MKILEGRELDAAVAERCFNLELCKYRERYAEWSDGKFVLSERMPNYSTDMAVAWQVAEWIREQSGKFCLEWDSYRKQWECIYWETHDDVRWVNADTPFEAICHAALELKKRLEVSE